MATRSPSCISALGQAGRILRPTASAIPLPGLPHTQIRGKKSGRPQDQGVVVRLLEDIPKFGRKDAIFRIERGRMRNQWFPSRRAEYMTATRFQELGISRHDIGERDPLFGAIGGSPEDGLADISAAWEAQTTRPEVLSVAPDRAFELLSTLVPETLVFSRKALPAPTPSSSPLLASNRSSTIPVKAGDEEVSPVLASPIFGSVTIDDILNSIRAALAPEAEASRIHLDADSIRFVGLDDGAKRVKSLGRWVVEITPPRSSSSSNLASESIKRTVVVVDDEVPRRVEAA